jgi:hypothetical protein
VTAQENKAAAWCGMIFGVAHSQPNFVDFQYAKVISVALSFILWHSSEHVMQQRK